MLLKYKSISVVDLLCVLLLFRTTIIEYSIKIIERIPVIGQFSTPVVQLILLVLFLSSFHRIIRLLSMSDYAFYVISVIILLVHCVLFLDNGVYLNEILYRIIFHVLPYFFVGRLLNYDRINKIAIIFGYISIIIFLFIRFVLHTNDDFNYVGGDMGGAYLILPSIILITLNAYETKKIIHISVAICGIIFLFMLGNRGSILYEITFVVLILLKNIKNTNAISKIFIVMLLVFLISQFDVIISRFEHIIEQYGFSTRIVDFLSDDNITEDSGRLYLWNNIFDSLKYNFWGLGITGDRVLLNGMYAHNVFIEILSSFGFFIGTIINVLLIYVLIKAYRCVRNTNESNFYIAMICFGLLPLLTSMSFIEYHYFFILVGYSIGIIKRYCGIRNRKYTILINN